MKYFITTPLYYVNDNPHIGSAYPTIACDFLAGHFVQTGAQLSFLTGTDEHGQKIEKAAKARGLSPKAHCDEIVSEFKRLWEILEINNTHFIRTSDDQHKAFVSDFFQKVKNNGYIYKGDYKGLYCVSCEDFKLEKDGVEYLDISEKVGTLFSMRPDLFKDRAHLNSVGASLFSTLLADELCASARSSLPQGL